MTQEETPSQAARIFAQGLCARFASMRPGDDIAPIVNKVARFEEQTRTEERRWRDAVTDALVVSHIYRAEHDSDPRKAINDLLCWEAKIALDPAVSKDAAALVEQTRTATEREVVAKAIEAIAADRRRFIEDSNSWRAYGFCIGILRALSEQKS
jgi:hypothetical protein